MCPCTNCVVLKTLTGLGTFWTISELYEDLDSGWNIGKGSLWLEDRDSGWNLERQPLDLDEESSAEVHLKAWKHQQHLYFSTQHLLINDILLLILK